MKISGIDFSNNEDYKFEPQKYAEEWVSGCTPKSFARYKSMTKEGLFKRFSNSIIPKSCWEIIYNLLHEGED